MRFPAIAEAGEGGIPARRGGPVRARPPARNLHLASGTELASTGWHGSCMQPAGMILAHIGRRAEATHKINDLPIVLDIMAVTRSSVPWIIKDLHAFAFTQHPETAPSLRPRNWHDTCYSAAPPSPSRTSAAPGNAAGTSPPSASRSAASRPSSASTRGPSVAMVRTCRCMPIVSVLCRST